MTSLREGGRSRKQNGMQLDDRTGVGVMAKERLAGDRFGEIMGFIAYFWLA